MPINTGIATLDFGDGGIIAGAAGIDPLWMNVISLMTWEGATVIDQEISTGGYWTNSGVLDHTITKYGAGSWKNSGAGGFNWGGPDFPVLLWSDYTMQTWIYITAYPVIDAEVISAETMDRLKVTVTTAGALRLDPGNPGSTAVGEPNYTFPLNTWVHICLMAKNHTLYLFVDGVPRVSAPQSTQMFPDPIVNFAYQFSMGTAYLDELRLDKIARYPVTGFTPAQCGISPKMGKQKTHTVITGQTGITSVSYCEAWINSSDSTDHPDYEHRMAPITVTCGDIVDGVGFTIHATSPIFLRGMWNVHWVWYNP